jgi:hypothetical protein
MVVVFDEILLFSLHFLNDSLWSFLNLKGLIDLLILQGTLRSLLLLFLVELVKKGVGMLLLFG